MVPSHIIQQNPKRASESPEGYARKIAVLAQREAVHDFYKAMETQIEEESRINAKRLTPAQQDTFSNVLIMLNDTKKRLLQ